MNDKAIKEIAGVNNAENTPGRGKGRPFKRGNPGRPKGAKDKIARTVKENIEQAFEDIGGVKELVTWAEKSNNNREKFYQWYFSMLPKNESVEHGGDFKVIVETIITDKREEEC